jgi:predicted nucleic acid-binding protein
MYLLDTDHISIFDRGGRTAQPLLAKLTRIPQDLRRTYPRLGTMDLKIASIALVHRATLLTRNTKDFGQIKNLVIEDWTI